MTEAELKRIEDEYVDPSMPEWRQIEADRDELVAEVRRLRSEREDLRLKAKAVRDYWRNNPGFNRDGISTPGMILLMAVER